MKGKDKCKILKEIRRQIAENNNIDWVTSECGHKGDCKGTCPKCESEVRKLERELEIRRKLGQTVAVAGLSVAVLSNTTGCSPIEAINNVIDMPDDDISGLIEEPTNINEENTEDKNIDELAGDVDVVPEDDTCIEETEKDENVGELEGDVVALPD